MKGWLWIGTTAAVVGTALAAPARAADRAEIQKAIDRGVKYLRGAALGNNPRLGVPALLGLTLLECGVPADDPAVRALAEQVQRGSIEVRDTYSISLAIMFLDRLDEEGDSVLIQSLAVRLVAGQYTKGDWGYICPGLGEDEVRRLTSALGKKAELRGSRDLPRYDPDKPRPKPPLPREVADLLNLIDRGGPVPANRLKVRGFQPDGLGDNSNTQFAVLGLWVARRHGVPAEKTLARAERRFRNTQNGNGGWSYQPRLPSSATMTCAGLLGLAVGHGLALEAALRTRDSKDPKTAAAARPARDPAGDPAVRAGLTILATALGPQAGRLNGVPAVIPRRSQNNVYYFFWSLERVAVIFDLQTIGKKDWYAWGSAILLASQGEDGTWEGDYGPTVDTCFALLFLRRANVARDLTISLKGRVQDPLEVALRNGGVGGGEAATRPAPKEGFNILEKPTGGKPSSGSSAGPNAPAAPPRGGDDEATRLAAELARAGPDQRGKLLDQYKNGKGAQYTAALASAIPRLPKAGQAPARDALAERLMRMTAATLREKLRDSDPEIRYAAARACASKEDRAHVPDLIPLLDDPESRVIRAARAALKFLTDGQDFGPAPDASAAERAKAMSQWRDWWKAHGLALLQKAGRKGP